MSLDENEIDSIGLQAIVLKGGAFLFLRQIISLILGLIGVAIITHLIGPERYGAYAAALGITQFALLLGPTGISVYLIRQVSHISDREYHLASTLLLLISILVILFIEATAGVMALWIKAIGFHQLLVILVLVSPAQLLSIVAGARLERTLDYRRIGTIEVSGHVVYYVIAVPMAFAGFGPWSLAGGWCLQQLFLCVALHIASRYSVRLAWNTQTAIRMLTYSAGYSTANCLWQIRFLVNPFIVGHFLGAGAVGQIGLAIRLVEIVSFVRGIAIRLSIPALARVQNQPQKLVRAITEGMQLQVLAIAPSLLMLAWFGPALVLSFFGQRWAPVMEVLPFIALGYLTSALFSMHSSVLSLLRRNGDISISNILHLLLFAPTVAFAIRKFGIVGYGIGELAGLMSFSLVHFMVVRTVGRPNYTISLLWWRAIRN